MSSFLVILPTEEDARRVYRQSGRGCWSLALPLVLEKYGHLGFALRGPSALEEPEILERFRCILIADLPQEVWRAEAVERLLASGAEVLIEAPIPPALAAALSIRVKPAKPEVTVTVTNEALATAARRFGADAGGTLAAGRSRGIDRDSQLDWEALPEVPITPQQADAWRAVGWRSECWDLPSEVEVLAEWSRSEQGRRYPAVVRARTFTLCSFGLLTHLGQSHTSEPSTGGEWRTSRRVTGLEVLLMGLLDQMHDRAKLAMARVLPWPAEAEWVLSVRHDFDRGLGLSNVERLLAGHADAGTSATWYWRARHLKSTLPGRIGKRKAWHGAASRTARLVAERSGHEVAHHTERLWLNAAKEQATIEAAIARPIKGTSAHGDPGCFRYQGAPNVMWAERQGLLYTELIQHAHSHPHRFAALRRDGTIAPLEVICLPHHESFDLSTKQGHTNREAVESAVPRYRDLGGMLQLMNHPDLHPDELFDVLRAFPKERRLDWTAAEAADWWDANTCEFPPRAGSCR